MKPIFKICFLDSSINKNSYNKMDNKIIIKLVFFIFLTSFVREAHQEYNSSLCDTVKCKLKIWFFILFVEEFSE